MATPPPIRIERIFISPGHNFFGHHGRPPSEHPTMEVRAVECVAGRGLRGDRYFDYKPDYPGQITFISAEVFGEVSQQLGVAGKSPGVTRRNVVTRGVDLNSLVGKKFLVQGIEFEGVAECSPCNWMNQAVAPGAETSLTERGGLRAKILTTGILRVDA